MTKEHEYTIEEHDGTRVIHLTGSVSKVTRKRITTLILKVIAQNSVIVNMTDVTLVTASGLEALIDVSSEARKKNRRVVFLGANENLRQLIEIFDVYEYFILVNSIAEGQMKIKFYV